MTILCLDTATDEGTVAVARDDGALASVRWRSAGRHGERLFGYIEQAMDKLGASREDLALIGVVIGPGKFTSLRVGLSTAKGLALGLNLPIVGISSLRLLARTFDCDAKTIRVPVMNAYRGDVFAAAYVIDDDGVKELVPPLFGPPERVFQHIRRATEGGSVVVGGEGVEPHAVTLETLLESGASRGNRSIDTSMPDAMIAEVRHVLRTTGPADIDSLEPQYLRSSDAKLPDSSRKGELSG